MKTVCYQDRKDILRQNRNSGMTQHFSFEEILLELNCDFICNSFSEFVNPARFHHDSPLISRLILVESGFVRLEVENQTVIIQPQQLYFLPAGLPFITEYHDHCITKGFHLHLYDGFNFSIAHDLHKLIVVDNPSLFLLIQQAIRQDNRPFVENAVMAAVSYCLPEIFPVMKERATVPPLYQKLLEAMRNTPPARLRLKDFSDKFNLTPTALSKGFYRQFDISWKDYQNRQILLRAQALLSGSDMTISEIAASLGYDDINYFYVFFRRHSNCSPQEYRKSIGHLD